MYKILKMEGRAKRAHMETVHGNIETPVFMNVGTAAAIKGAVSTEDLQQIGTQVERSNTYHLHVRPGDEDPDRLRRIPGILSCRPSENQGGGSLFPLPRRRKKDLYGT